MVERVGFTERQVEEMYRYMAIADYEDRFVIPTSHKETATTAYDQRGTCGFSFGSSCSEGNSKFSLFGRDTRDRKSTRLNSSHSCATSMPYSACKKHTTKQ